MSLPAETAGADAADSVPDRPLGESRWPPIVAVLVFLALNVGLRISLGGEGVVRLPWLVPAIEVALVVALVTSNPSGLADRRRLRRIAFGIV